jgi:hypothetical protein
MSLTKKNNLEWVSAQESSREKTPQEPAKYCIATEAGYLQAAGQYSV